MRLPQSSLGEELGWFVCLFFLLRPVASTSFVFWCREGVGRGGCVEAMAPKTYYALSTWRCCPFCLDYRAAFNFLWEMTGFDSRSSHILCLFASPRLLLEGCMPEISLLGFFVLSLVFLWSIF